MTDPGLTELTAARLVEGYRKGEFSPEEVTRAALERSERIQPEVNAFVRLPANEALAQARVSTERWRRGEPKGLVDGVPTTVKDILLLRGAPTLKGSRTIPESGRWDEDAPRSPGCVSTAPCSSARPRHRSSAGRA